MKARCTHHWIIPPAQGKTGKGRCKYCGAEREFLNSVTEKFQHPNGMDGEMKRAREQFYNNLKIAMW